MILLLALLINSQSFAKSHADCDMLPGHEALKKSLAAAQKMKNGGLAQDMWGAIVGRSGVVCAVTYTGKDIEAQWRGSRLIAIEKANTANSFALPKQAISTANLYSGTQPGGFLFGVADSHPVNLPAAYKGPDDEYGTEKDPAVGEIVGGVNTFGGGLALYDASENLVGAIGVSGDTSCADYNVAWRTRHSLEYDYVPAGIGKNKLDQIIYDVHLGKSLSGFGHPDCGMGESKVAKDLPAIRKPAPLL